MRLYPAFIEIRNYSIYLDTTNLTYSKTGASSAIIFLQIEPSFNII